MEHRRQSGSDGFIDHGETGGGDAGDITYTPTTLADWTGSSDPGDVDEALDQLAGRVTDLEAAPATDNDAIHDNVSGEISAITEKLAPVSTDLLLIEDSAASDAKKKVQIGNLAGGIAVEDLATAETDTALVLAPDGVGGVEFRAETGGGGGGSSFNIWMPDAPPTSAGAEDDEFADASGGVPTGWTEVDHGTHLAVDEDEAGLELSNTNAGGSYENAGIYKAIPAGDFTIWTKVSLVGPFNSNYAVGGLALWEDATDITKKVTPFYYYSYSSNLTLECQNYTNYNTFASSNASQNTNNKLVTTGMYLRVRRSGTTYAFDWSTDGIGWLRVFSGSLSFTPTHFGPVAGVNTASTDHHARFAFFRYVASDVGITGLVKGNRGSAGGGGSESWHPFLY